ncbi:PepSY domain-containing protein [Agrobacterium fabrum]|uniref:PepSY domain-containing protein n=2 Tax=Agrobacterium fabrum TaxID=1176649 RepID=A9CLE9_AGRFC|nr:hypothetical protein Atu5288 [Agrobacterium fabrum str. C58]TRB28001.1 PepSY domain-containing protein [Agrobacterium fabrum]
MIDRADRAGTISLQRGYLTGSVHEVPNTRGSPMKNAIFAAALFSATSISAFAQTAPTANNNGDTPAVATPDTKNPTAPVEGANSFTEAQAKDRIEKAGYSDVKDLKKDDKGIWNAAGMKDGKAVSIALDYQGNVVAK